MRFLILCKPYRYVYISLCKVIISLAFKKKCYSFIHVCFLLPIKKREIFDSEIYIFALKVPLKILVFYFKCYAKTAAHFVYIFRLPQYLKVICNLRNHILEMAFFCLFPNL